MEMCSEQRAMGIHKSACLLFRKRSPVRISVLKTREDMYEL
jgi:hypothetical protein